MYEYGHGGNAVFEPNGAGLLDLSANINPLGIPEGVGEAIRNGTELINRYPDCYNTELRRNIGAYEGVPTEWIFCGNGASDIIFRIPAVLRPKEVLIAVPTFSDYERSVKAWGADIIFHYLDKDGFRADSKLIQAYERNPADLVFLCNPNNPTGVLTGRGLIAELLECCKKRRATVVVDECFMDFLPQSEILTAKGLLNEYGNLIILKAFTKTFAMPGIRLGYCLCANPDTIQRLYTRGPDWALSNLAQDAGIAALRQGREYIRRTVSFIDTEGGLLRRELASLGFEVIDGKANYVFFRNPYEFDLCAELDKRSIRIRSCANYRGLSGDYCRAAVSTKGDNARLITAVKEVLECRSQ